jgi:putative ABC transport system permease protein
VGTVVTMISSIFPARRAARVAPVQALRESADSASGSLRRRLIVGLILTAAAVAALLYGLFGNPSNAGSLIGPGGRGDVRRHRDPVAARRPPARGSDRGPIRRLGIQGKLGSRERHAQPSADGVDCSALMIGLGLVAMVTVLAASLKASLDLTLEKALKADLVLTTSSQTPFSPDVADRVREVDGVAAVSQFRQGGFRVRGRRPF